MRTRSEDKRFKAVGLGRHANVFAAFFLGLVAALCIGWWLFPMLMYKEVPQPVAFTHASHIELFDCADCHYLREDGSFSGIPTTEDCLQCHDTPKGDSHAEAEYIEKYAAEEKKVPWLVHQKQPDNVFFSHAAHDIKSCQKMGCHPEWEAPEDLCVYCHPSIDALDKPVPYQENRLTGYSKSTMKMADCESCHANPNHQGITNANNACFTCHK